MAEITLRVPLGRPLTYQEVDDNFKSVQELTLLAQQFALTAQEASTLADAAKNEAIAAKDEALIASGSAALDAQRAEDAADRAEAIADFDGLHNTLAGRNEPNAHDASAIGFRQSGEGAISRSVAEKLRENASLSDFATGNGVVDDTDAIEDFLSKAVGVVRIPRNSTFVISRPLTISNPLLAGLVGDCPESSVLKFTGTGSLQFVQDISELPPLEMGFTVSGKSEILLSETSEVDIENGDVIILWNPDPYSLNPDREYYYDGFMSQVHRVDGEKIYTYGKTAKINESNIRLFRMKRRSFLLKDFSFYAEGATTQIRITHYVGVRVSGIASKGIGSPLAIKLDKSFDINVEFSRVTSTESNAYPVQISNCQNFIISGFTGNSTRNGVGLGGDGFLASVPPRNGLIQGCRLMNFQPDSVGGVGIPAAGIHSNTIGITYRDCYISSGAGANGKDVKFIDCVIESYTVPDQGTCVSCVSPMGEILFNRCRFDVTRRGVSDNSQIISIAPAYEIDDEIKVVIRDCVINIVDDPTGSSVFPFARVIKGRNKNKIRLIIDGLSSRGTSLIYNEIVRVRYSGSSPDPDAELFIEIKNVEGINYQNYCTGVSSGDSNTKFRIKGWSQKGELPLVADETESSTDIYGPIRYPRSPAANAVTVGTPGAAGGWILLCRGFADARVTIYARTLSGENLFTGNMSFQVESSLIEF